MSLLARRRKKPTFGGRRSVSTDRDRQALTKQLQRGLDELARRAQQPGLTLLEVQPLLQVVGSASYPEFRRAREKAWHKQGGTYSTKRWPSQLQDGEVAALLLPLSAGRVGPAIGKHPAPIADPLFSVGTPTPGAGGSDACLGLIASWVCNPADESITARLAPPVVEIIQRGRAVERAVDTFGIAWPLPAADGL